MIESILHGQLLRLLQLSMHEVTSADAKPQELGPIKVMVNGAEATTMIDTGSPVTIVSLEFVMEVMAQGKEKYHTIADWKRETLNKF